MGFGFGAGDRGAGGCRGAREQAKAEILCLARAFGQGGGTALGTTGCWGLLQQETYKMAQGEGAWRWKRLGWGRGGGIRDVWKWEWGEEGE